MNLAPPAVIAPSAVRRRGGLRGVRGLGGLRGVRGLRRRPVVALVIGLVLLAVLAVLSVLVGTRGIDPAVVWAAVVDFDPTDDRHLVVAELRLPRTALAALVGAALGVAGAVMQALTRNPLAEPGILGVNAGAAAAAATGIAVSGAAFGGMPGGVFGTLAFAFAGAAVASVLVAALGGMFRTGADPIRLTLAGAALSVVLGAYTNALLLNFPTVFDTFRHWAVGSVQGRGPELVLPATLVIVPTLLAACLLGPSFNAIALGRELGRSLGADPRRVLSAGAVIIVLLAGGATAIAGPIVFVGLAAPLGVRLLVGPDYRWILPLSAVAAAALVLGSDIIGRLILPGAEVETSIVTALIGAPIFILLARRRRLMRL
ncbi:FecCD family ABC transporter permease [Agromyces larvae]|uniref:Iron ABC transporter permease n=1 Tax=Agromyces larvae TaxID=2929802 RepID=A0ABY4BVN0_9MICO|nr:iron ABC transporter permease [Agromyces larvae]UOE43230.1 iron ABC transporter permease [Agromyces larvae]